MPAGVLRFIALRAWVYRIAHARTALAFRRRPPATVEFDQAESAGAIVEANDSADGEFSADDAAEVYAALDVVSIEHREVLLLRYVEQMNYEQIAEVTSCGVGTVRSRLHYAKLRLREAMERRRDG